MIGFPGLEYLAKEAGMSTTKLKTDFKKIYGVPPYQFFRQLQMQSAKQLLEDKDIPIKKLAQLFKYESQYKFSMSFRQIHGVFPTELKKLNK